ncbi:CDP-alcohol phosphatidyltransferase family protein [Nocardia sp. CA-107356]|uniref:CDP-alcohol phosphatidyltransferase family protein n=1 Tax=Nocardia sp. CA-107356 TaxID=3239972 RepID=UPI003D8D62F8
MTTESGKTDPGERADSGTGDPAVGGIFDDRIFTVPNALSVLRLAGVPLFLWLLLVVRADGWAFALLVASGVTDFLDGKLARLLDQSSRLGALLDPFVDRLYLITTLAAFVIRGLLPWWVAVILIGRDAILALTLSVYKRRDLDPPEVIYLGKAATFALMSALPWLLAGQMDWALAGFGRAFGGAFLVWGTAVYAWTGVLYIWKAFAVARAIPAVPHHSE